MKLIATVEIEVSGEDVTGAKEAVFRMLSQAKSSRRKRKGSEAAVPVVVGVRVEEKSSPFPLDWSQITHIPMRTTDHVPNIHTQFGIDNPVAISKTTDVSDVVESKTSSAR